MTINNKKKIHDYIFIAVGTLILAISISVFFQPNQLVTGGVTGLSIIIQELSIRLFGFSIPLWFANLALNAPLFLFAVKIFGIKRVYRTFIATLLTSFWLYFTDHLPMFSSDDLILVALFGGAISGVGLGLVFRALATTGGSDLMASIIHHKTARMSIAKIMFIIDSVIIALGVFVFGIEKSLYGIIVVFVCARVIDTMLEGLSFAKAAFIISESSENIASVIIQELDRGVTSINGKGMYTNNSKNILLCVVSSKEIVRLKQLVYKCDSSAFVIVADVREVLGEGFQSI